MVDDFYEFGMKILDPSCGSGIFLVQIILEILNSQNSLPAKVKAIANVYGFDVNPLAIITTKANIFLIIRALTNFYPHSRSSPNTSKVWGEIVD